jgi:AraC family transcriptional activator of tynA and feaB
MASSYQTLATSDLPKGKAVELWSAFGSETLSDMIVDPDDREPFNARLSRVEVGDVGVVWMETSAARATRRSSELGRWAATSDDAFLLTVQETGQSWLEHGARWGTLQPGDMILRSSNRPWATRSYTNMSTVTLKLPARRVLARLNDPERFAGRIFEGSLAPVCMASSIILSIKRSLADRPEASWSEALADVVLDTLSVACAEGIHGSREQPVLDSANRVLWAQVCQFVEDTLCDPELAVTSIATEMGMSIRSLQRLFVTAGVTPSRYILDRRLNRAATILRGAGRHSVTEIAYSLGFNELSYFSRAFATRFGVSPRRYRTSVAS